MHEDPLVHEILCDMADKIACALTGVVNMLNPSAIFIGHCGALLNDIYIQRIEDRVNAMKLSGNYQTVRVQKSFFGEDAPLFGSACIVLNRLFDGKILAHLDA